ncbi:MAG: riboflavin biosynthesis protein RibF, partial [Clostridia bacterium]|nr:riboflavin biosynthesis protein RibF [Clostridia bacterium]
DGMHAAHRTLLQRTVCIARESGLTPAVFTFSDPDFKGKGMLLSPGERFATMEEAGIRVVFAPEFSSLCHLDAKEFVTDILQKTCSAAFCVCGYNFAFGKNAAGHPDLLSSLIPTEIVPPLTLGGQEISSSRIRAALREGDVALADALLGHPYAVTGKVLRGKAMGRTLGFPTANMSPDCLLPENGVYAVRVVLPDGTYPGLCDVGVRPTAEKAGQRRAETYIHGFDGELYDKTITVAFLRQIRKERRFASLEDLKEQMKKDLLLAKKDWEEK